MDRQPRLRAGVADPRPASQESSTVLDAGVSSMAPGGGVVGVYQPRRVANSRYSDAARRMSVKVPKDGIMMKITNVFDVYRSVRLLVGMIANAWGLTSQVTTHFRQVMPGLIKIDAGNQVHVCPGYLLSDLMGVCVSQSSMGSTGRSLDEGDMVVKDIRVQEMQLRAPSAYFADVLLLLKLRFLLRIHSACSELDYKMCSFKNLILGLQYVMIQQHAEAETDNVFDTKVSNQVGSHCQLESVVDDIFDQIERALGKSWRGFLEYTYTCDPMRCIQSSKMDSTLTPLKIASNDNLAVVLDTIFLTNFLRRSRQDACGNLREFYDELDSLGVHLPEVPPLRGAPHIKAWVRAQTKPTRQDRERVASKDHEKLAQLDAVLLAAAVELHLPEVIASAEEIAEALVINREVTMGASAPEPASFGSTGRAPGSAGPPAARVILVDKPQLSPAIFEVAVHLIHHHMTFPDGIRERLYILLMDEYGMTKDNQQKLAIAVTQNIDGKRLSEDTLLCMEHRERTRLRQWQSDTNMNTSHLLIGPLVAAPIEKGKPARYTIDPPVLPRAKFGSYDMTKSLPDLRGFAAKRAPAGASPFKVPMSTGPLTMDHDLKKLRTTGLFIKMPPLGP